MIIDCLSFQRRSFVPCVCVCASSCSSSSCVSASTPPCDACACDRDRDWAWPTRHYGNLHVYMYAIILRYHISTTN